MAAKTKAQKATQPSAAALPCVKPCDQVVKFLTDQQVAANVGFSTGQYTNVEGYKHINIFVRFSQETANEDPVDLGVMFAFDKAGAMAARRYVNLESNVASQQPTNFIEVSGSGSWHGQQWKISSYIARLPIMGPFVQVFVYNKAAFARKVSVWVYLVA
jgi:hypothetical protein